MKQFTLVNGDTDVTFNFPTSLSDITKEYLLGVTSHLRIADHHTLVGLVYHETIGSLVIARKQAKKGLTAGVVPIFIKAGNTDSNFIKSANCKDKLIIPTSSLNVAYHVTIPENELSLDYFIKHLDRDNNIVKRYNGNYGNEACFFVEFKLVPNVNIVGFYDEATKLNIKHYVKFNESKVTEQ